MQTLRDYGVPEDQVCGIRYGLRGFYEKEFKPVNLEDKMVDSIHLKVRTVGWCGAVCNWAGSDRV